MKKDIKFEALRTYATGNITVLADNQKAYNRHLETTQNTIIALIRASKIPLKDIVEFIKDTKANNEFNAELGKALGLLKEVDAVSTPTKTNRKSTK